MIINIQKCWKLLNIGEGVKLVSASVLEDYLPTENIGGPALLPPPGSEAYIRVMLYPYILIHIRQTHICAYLLSDLKKLFDRHNFMIYLSTIYQSLLLILHDN